ncbi:heavy metal translocating P-type ATPase [Carnobacterium funditum]|uniref:heavy metal translocating P-type ATPase n=1 Tax=Carnobacterium funditum TaxID=2752 RepID=UPI001B806E21
MKHHEWILEGIDCANCASKIENGVSKIEGVTNSNANYMTKTLSFDIEEQKENGTLTVIKSKINKLEPDVTLLSKSTGLLIGKNGLSINNTSLSKSKDNHHLEDLNQSHDHSHEEQEGNEGHSHGESTVKTTVTRLIISLALLLVANFVPMNEFMSLGLFVAAYLVAGYDIVWRAIKNMFNGQLFDENFLMTIATISAFYIQEYPEAVAVMLFYQVGEVFQGVAVNRSRRSISDLMDIRPDYANLKLADGSTRSVSPDTIKVGDTIVIRPGEKVPLDGKIITGISSMDTSALTGESIPRSVEATDSVLSGFINKNGLIEVTVEKLFSESTVTKILDLVENASSRKAPTENFITKFARYYTPIVVIFALVLAIIPPLVIPGATFNEWIYRASIFLVISCPCALVVSIPVGFFGGIGSASKKGILVKGSNFLEGLNDIKYVIMDKTGTLTKGKFEITDIQPTGGLNKNQLLELVAYAETHSSHPIADSIKEKYVKKIDENRITEYNDISGYGIHARVDGKEILAGNSKLMQKHKIVFTESTEVGTIIYVAVDKEYAGYILIADAIKEDAAEGIAIMKEKGVQHIIMLTGDSKTVGEAVARKLGIDEFYAELLPQDKVEKMEEIMARKGPKEKVAFVGDGINDTPVLARSDIGIAMGGLGSDAAIEAADIVIMDDKPSKIGTAMQVAKDTQRIVWQNIILALSVKVFFLIIGAFGFATMWEAVFADVGVTVIAVLNAMRVLKK